MLDWECVRSKPAANSGLTAAADGDVGEESNRTVTIERSGGHVARCLSVTELDSIALDRFEQS